MTVLEFSLIYPVNPSYNISFSNSIISNDNICVPGVPVLPTEPTSDRSPELECAQSSRSRSAPVGVYLDDEHMEIPDQDQAGFGVGGSSGTEPPSAAEGETESSQRVNLPYRRGGKRIKEGRLTIHMHPDSVKEFKRIAKAKGVTHSILGEDYILSGLSLEVL